MISYLIPIAEFLFVLTLLYITWLKFREHLQLRREEYADQGNQADLSPEISAKQKRAA